MLEIEPNPTISEWILREQDTAEITRIWEGEFASGECAFIALFVQLQLQSGKMHPSPSHTSSQASASFLCKTNAFYAIDSQTHPSFINTLIICIPIVSRVSSSVWSSR